MLQHLSVCVEKGKSDKNTPIPPELRDQDGASEITRQLLDMGVNANVILQDGLVPGMNRVGELFAEGKVFIPGLLTATRAMNAATVHLKPYFASGEIKRRGTFIIGTVMGDLHDIGKNLVGYALEGAGWEVIDLGTDVSGDKFVDAIKEHPEAVVGISALLTVTMVYMEDIIRDIKKLSPTTKVLIGGAPINQSFCDQVGADFYSPDPYHAVQYLKNAV